MWPNLDENTELKRMVKVLELHYNMASRVCIYIYLNQSAVTALYKRAQAAVQEWTGLSLRMEHYWHLCYFFVLTIRQYLSPFEPQRFVLFSLLYRKTYGTVTPKLWFIPNHDFCVHPYLSHRLSFLQMIHLELKQISQKLSSCKIYLSVCLSVAGWLHHW